MSKCGVPRVASPSEYYPPCLWTGWFLFWYFTGKKSLSPPPPYADTPQVDRITGMKIAKKQYFGLLEKAEKYDSILPTHKKMYVELYRRQQQIDILQEAVDNQQKQLKK